MNSLRRRIGWAFSSCPVGPAATPGSAGRIGKAIRREWPPPRSPVRSPVCAIIRGSSSGSMAATARLLRMWSRCTSEFCRGRAVAAKEPDEDARMIAQTGDLTGERGGGHSLQIAFPILPALPGVAAGPTGHDENAQPIRLLKEFIAIKVAFEANGIQAHVTN